MANNSAGCPGELSSGPSVKIVHEVCFELIEGLAADGGVDYESWRCGRCHHPVLVSWRNHVRRFKDHLKEAGCVEEARAEQSSVRLAVSAADSPAAYFARGVVPIDLCAKSLDFTGLKFSQITLSAGDTREQSLFPMRSPRAGSRVIRLVVQHMNRAFPGSTWVVRSSTGFYLRKGSTLQVVHCDSMEETGTHRGGCDSVTLFVCLSPQGRSLGIMGPGGLEVVHLRQGDVAVLSAGCYHCGMANPGDCEVLFCYLDRHYCGSLGRARGEVGGIWDDLTAEAQAGYCATLRFVGGFTGLVHALQHAYQMQVGHSKRTRSD